MCELFLVESKQTPFVDFWFVSYLWPLVEFKFKEVKPISTKLCAALREITVVDVSFLFFSL